MSKSVISNSAELARHIRNCRKANIPMVIFGAAGIGKSAIVHQAADGDPVIDLRLSMVEPFDLRGLPTITGEKSVLWARPSWLPTKGRGILFLDEINTAAESVLNAALQLVLDRRCGDHKLGDGWYIVAAGNQSVHNPTVNPLPAPLINRMCAVHYEPTADAWREWAQGAGVDTDVVNFLSLRPDLLATDPTDEYSNFASPRQWTSVSKLLKDGICEPMLFSGLVGPGPAAEFGAYLGRYRQKLPNIDLVAAGKASVDTKTLSATESDALAQALVSRMGGDPARVDIGHCCRIILSMPAEIARNCLVKIMRLDHVRGAAMAVAEFQEWVRQNQHLLQPRFR